MSKAIDGPFLSIELLAGREPAGRNPWQLVALCVW
jgi:hypothetical protein